MCKTDYGGDGGGGIPNSDYVICERPLIGKYLNILTTVKPLYTGLLKKQQMHGTERKSNVHVIKVLLYYYSHKHIAKSI